MPNGDVTTPHTAVLVEGRSDQVALLTLAGRDDRDLAAEGIEVVPMGGITNIRSFASHYGPLGLGLELTGLYDAPGETWVRTGWRRTASRVPSSVPTSPVWGSSGARRIWRTSSSGRWAWAGSKP